MRKRAKRQQIVLIVPPMGSILSANDKAVLANSRSFGAWRAANWAAVASRADPSAARLRPAPGAASASAAIGASTTHTIP